MAARVILGDTIQWGERGQPVRLDVWAVSLSTPPAVRIHYRQGDSITVHRETDPEFNRLVRGVIATGGPYEPVLDWLREHDAVPAEWLDALPATV